TSYGAKATIRYEPIVDYHIEHHVLVPINVNCSDFDQEDLPSPCEAYTKLGCILELTLDEWVNKRHAFDPYKEMEESELGVYYFDEENHLVPNIIKQDHKDNIE
ncbi:hypothetical protein KI387_019288, partial [Taxus chinensis]